jgi:DNA-binding FadR family transcriptional regulator
LSATHNSAMMALSASISAAVSWTTEFKQRSRALPRDPVPDHAKVFDAIAAGDPDAASAACAPSSTWRSMTPARRCSAALEGLC